MARTKTRPDTARSAAHAATGPAPACTTAPAPDSPAAAVSAALAASPGGSVAVIADAAGTSKPAARDALLAMEKDGTATRVKGGKPGTPDTWTLADPAQDDPAQADAGPADAGPGDEQDVQPSDATASSTDGPGDDVTAGEADQDADAGTEAEAGDGTSAEPDLETGTPGPRDDAPAGGDHDDEAVPDGDPRDPGDAPREDAAPDASDSEASDAPDPALITGLIERLDQIRAAADAAELVLTAQGDLKTVLAGLDEIYDQAAEARRSLKAAIGGRKTPAARPGGLRDSVLAHLQANPGAQFTPHQIHNVLGNSSGAIANALDTLVKRGEAELSCEKPRRFRLAGSPPDAATDDAATDDAVTDDPGDGDPGDGDRADDSTQMAGAA